MPISRRLLAARLRGDSAAETVIRASSLGPAGELRVELQRDEDEGTTALVIRPNRSILDGDGYDLPTSLVVRHPDAVRGLAFALITLLADPRAAALLKTIPTPALEARR